MPNEPQSLEEQVIAAATAENVGDQIRLANLGRRYPTLKLLKQLDYTNGLADEFKDSLRESGFTDEMKEALTKKSATLSAAMSLRHAARTDAQAATRSEGVAVTNAKNHVKMIDELVPMLVRKHKITDITPADLQPMGTLGRSTTKLLKHLRDTRGLVARLEVHLKQHFRGQSPLAVHDKITEELAATNLKQEAKIKRLPNSNFDLLRVKGELVEMIDDFNRIGRVAHIADERTCARFNTDLLKAPSRKRRKGATESDVTEESEETDEIDESGEVDEVDEQEAVEPK